MTRRQSYHMKHLSSCNIVHLGSWILMQLSNAEGYLTENNSSSKVDVIFLSRHHFSVSYELNLAMTHPLEL